MAKITYKNKPTKIFIIERRKSDEKSKKKRQQFNRGNTMATISKTITDRYGNTASFFILETGNIVPDTATGDISAPDYQLLAYKDEQAYLDGYTFVDCLRPRISMLITEEDRDLETGSNDVEKQVKAFLRKATVSVLDTENNETNLFDGLVRDVSFIGCEIV